MATTDAARAVVIDVALIGLIIIFWVVMDPLFVNDLIYLAENDPDTLINERQLQDTMLNLFRLLSYIFIAIVIIHMFVVIVRRGGDIRETTIGLG